jgi:hypothetical protein
MSEKISAANNTHHCSASCHIQPSRFVLTGWVSAAAEKIFTLCLVLSIQVIAVLSDL